MHLQPGFPINTIERHADTSGRETLDWTAPGIYHVVGKHDARREYYFAIGRLRPVFLAFGVTNTVKPCATGPKVDGTDRHHPALRPPPLLYMFRFREDFKHEFARRIEKLGKCKFRVALLYGNTHCSSPLAVLSCAWSFWIYPSRFLRLSSHS